MQPRSDRFKRSKARLHCYGSHTLVDKDKPQSSNQAQPFFSPCPSALDEVPPPNKLAVAEVTADARAWTCCCIRASALVDCADVVVGGREREITKEAQLRSGHLLRHTCINERSCFRAQKSHHTYATHLRAQVLACSFPAPSATQKC